MLFLTHSMSVQRKKQSETRLLFLEQELRGMVCSRTKGPLLAKGQAVLVPTKYFLSSGIWSMLLDSRLKKEASCGQLQLL